MENKTCNCCKNEKPTEEFFERNKSNCKDCVRQKDRERRALNRDEINARQRLANQQNPERKRAHAKKDRERHPERIKNSCRAYQEKNREHVREQKKQYNQRNKEIVEARSKKYYEENREEIIRKSKARFNDPNKKAQIKATKKAYYEKNKKEINRKSHEQKKERMKTNQQARLADKLRKRLYLTLKNSKGTKTSSALTLLGCTLEYFKKHLEALWKPGMTWKNWGSGEGFWVLEHTIPIAFFDLTDPVQQTACFHYTNITPMWWDKNHVKSDWMEHEGEMVRGRELREKNKLNKKLKETFIIDQIDINQGLLF